MHYAKEAHIVVPAEQSNRVVGTQHRWPGYERRSDASRNLRAHHFPAIELAPVHYEGAIAHCVNGSLLFSGTVEIRRHGFENDDVVPADDVSDLALDVCQAVPDQGRPDMLCPYRSQPEFPELVTPRFLQIGAGACPRANDLIDQVDRGDRNHALAEFSQRGVLARARICTPHAWSMRVW